MSTAHPTPPRRARSGACRAALAMTAALFSPSFSSAQNDRGIPPDEPRPTQRRIETPPPAIPAETPADPGAPLPPLPPVGDPALRLQRVTGSSDPAQPPPAFNPDPGAAFKSPPQETPPFFTTHQVPEPERAEARPVPPSLALPRAPLERPLLEKEPPPAPPSYGWDRLTGLFQLPRFGVRENQSIPHDWHAPKRYPLAEAGEGFPPRSTPVPDRWRHTGFVPWRRYTAGDTNELPYFHAAPELWHPYRQSILKGDLPVHGQDLFLNLTASGEIVTEDRLLTVPSGASAARAGSFDFYGDSRSRIIVTNLAIQADLFRGETVFRPVEWLVRIKPVFNFNRVAVREAGLVSPDPRGNLGGGGAVPPDNTGVTHPGDIDGLLNGGLAPAPGDFSRSRHTTRHKTYFALQEAFVEKHLLDLSASYDFCAIKAGNQTFNSDFRGFIFNDTNLGARFFGNHDNNRWQYNAALFDLREKDTNSELNTFDRRGQLVFVANVYRQDFWQQGYTAQLSFHASLDEPATHYDTNGAIVRPAPLGTVRPHRVNSYYLGWAGDGHLGRWNISHAAYLVLGRDEFNGLAGQPADITAGMAALEVSYDRDWIRYKASVFYASGDRHPEDGRATGFDAILPNTNFTGGPFSYFVRQGFNLGGTAVGLKQRFSLLPNLRTSQTQGQANFVNPGLVLCGLGAEIEVTPRLRAFTNANCLRFDSSETLKTALHTNQVGNAIGTDLSLGLQWRPLLTDNIIVTAGCGALLPSRGFRNIFRRTQPAVPGFAGSTSGARVDRFLYSAILAINLTH